MNYTWLPWLAKDALFTHPVLFCILVVESLLNKTPLGSKAQYHLCQTFTFINQRLSNKALALHDTTIFVVATLVIFSTYLRDYATAMIHMKGLRRMVELRGGLESFRYHPRLYTKLGRSVHPRPLQASSSLALYQSQPRSLPLLWQRSLLSHE
jgi:hypothetical protein